MDNKKYCSRDRGDVEVRKGPWTMEEDLILINYIANHGEGVWNSLARCAGLKRTGKSCRLRWLNYLRPDVRRGNITPEEHLLIMELHAKWGNRWSKIAKHLPGRTDNEIKNFWRTRIQKHIKQQAENFTGGGQIIRSDQQKELLEAAAAANTTSCQSISVAETAEAAAAHHGHVHVHALERYSSSSISNYNTMDMDTTFQNPFSTDQSSNDINLWSMEDLWPLQFS